MISKALLAALLIAGWVSGTEELRADDPRTIALECSPEAFDRSKVDLLPGVSITSLSAEMRANYTAINLFDQLPFMTDLFFCQIKVHLNHDGSDDSSLVEVWLPPGKEDWNGRFQATGGAGFATGLFDTNLAPALKQGFAAASTDGGHDWTKVDDASWALKADGTIDLDLMRNFATRSSAEQIIVGKAITEQYYGEKPHHSYWNGCSTGGRQGYEVAQNYPHLLDGVLANAPAISMPPLAMSDFWPQLVMKEAGVWMSHCEFNFFLQKSMEDCDMLDGVSDGVITDPDVCDHDPLHAIGKTFYCDGKEGQVTAAMADVVRRIQEGPRTPFKGKIWHGYPVGTSMDYVAATTTSPTGSRLSVPFPISASFIHTLLLKDPSFNITKLSMAGYLALWAQANNEFGWLLDADEPNLRTLKDAGTKLLTWHGVNDPVIPYHNSVQYRERVETVMGGAHNVDQFFRLFLAPGVGHCSGGAGPVPRDPLIALIDWVEKGEAPETLEASTVNAEGDMVTRDLCAWPGKVKYMGIGDAKRASSWSCIGGTERLEVEDETAEDSHGRAGDIIGGLKDRLAGLGLGLQIG